MKITIKGQNDVMLSPVAENCCPINNIYKPLAAFENFPDPSLQR